VTKDVSSRATTAAVPAAYGARPRPLAPLSTEAERAAHETFIRQALTDKAVWLKHGL